MVFRGRKSPQGLHRLHHRPKLAPGDEKNIKKNDRKKGELYLRCIKKTSVTHNSHAVVLMEKVLSGSHKRTVGERQMADKVFHIKHYFVLSMKVTVSGDNKRTFELIHA